MLLIRHKNVYDVTVFNGFLPRWSGIPACSRLTLLLLICFTLLSFRDIFVLQNEMKDE